MVMERLQLCRNLKILGEWLRLPGNVLISSSERLSCDKVQMLELARFCLIHILDSVTTQ